MTGRMFVTTEMEMGGRSRIIINFPTKEQWRYPSRYSYIENGLKDLRHVIEDRHIQSIAIPPLGSSNGGLDWERVRPMIEQALGDLSCTIEIFEPNAVIQEKMKAERVRLTPARAMLIVVMADMLKEEENPSEFAAEKIAYFLQKFGAKDAFNLKYNKGFYGPYSGKVRYVLHYLNGSYIMGMDTLSNHPFDVITILKDAPEEAMAFLKKGENAKYLSVITQTRKFLRGYYSNYLLELLATTSFLVDTDPRMKEAGDTEKVEIIGKDLMKWSNRKNRLFNTTKAIELALRHLSEADFCYTYE